MDGTNRIFEAIRIFLHPNGIAAIISISTMLAPGPLTNFHDYEQGSHVGNDTRSSKCGPTKHEFSSDDDIALMLSSAPEQIRHWSMDRNLSVGRADSDSVKNRYGLPYGDLETELYQSGSEGLWIDADTQNKFMNNNCGVCDLPVTGPYVHVISGQRYHKNCLECSICGKQLTSSCFVKEGKLYCKDDYTRIWKTCRVCELKIEKGETFVKLITSYLCHGSCFRCGDCGRAFEKGDKCHINNHRDNERRFTGLCSVVVFCCGNVQRRSRRVDDEEPSLASVVMSPQSLSNWKRRLETVNLKRVSFSIESRSFTCDNCWKTNHNISDNDPLSTQMELEGKKLTSDQYQNDAMSANAASPRSQSSVESSKSANSYDDDRDITTADNPASNEAERDKDDLAMKDEADLDDKRVKRPRTILSAAQRQRFCNVFNSSPKPSRKAREELAAETGLTVRVVQVWFQNQRAKMKKQKKRQQAREQPLASRNQYGYPAYDTGMPLTHLAFNNESISDPRFNPFHNRHHDQWSVTPGFQEIFPTNTYMDIMHPSGPDGAINSPRLGDFASCHPSVLDGQMEQAIITNAIPPISETPQSQGITNEDIRTAVDGLFSLQNQYYES